MVTPQGAPSGDPVVRCRRKDEYLIQTTLAEDLVVRDRVKPDAARDALALEVVKTAERLSGALGWAHRLGTRKDALDAVEAECPTAGEERTAALRAEADRWENETVAWSLAVENGVLRLDERFAVFLEGIGKEGAAIAGVIREASQKRVKAHVRKELRFELEGAEP